MKGTKDYYNKAAEEWLNRRKDDDSVLPMFKKLLRFLPSSPRILDLCCGVGYDSNRLVKLGAKVVGLDYSDTSIALAKENYPAIDFVVEDMLSDYSYLDKFDGCIFLAGLVHLPTEKMKDAFQQLHNVMKDESYLLIVSRDGIGKSERMSIKEIEGELFDRQFYDHTLEEIKDAATSSFRFVEEHVDDPTSLWKNYIFKKI